MTIKINTILKIIIMMLIVVLLSFIGYTSVETPTLSEIKSLKINSYQSGAFKGDAEIGIENKNWYQITCKKLSFKLDYQGHTFAIGSLINPTVLEKKSVTNMQIEFSFYLDSLKDDLKEFLMQDSIKVTNTIDGKFSVLGISINETQEMWIKPNDIINQTLRTNFEKNETGVNDINIKAITPQKTTVEIKLNFPNEFPLDINLKKLNAGFYADKECKTKVGDWTNEESKLIPKDSVANIIGLVEFDNMQSGLTGIAKVLSGGLDYYFKGYTLIELDSREIMIPLFQHFLVNPLNRKVTILKD